jgi:iron complex transport system permease protein
MLLSLAVCTAAWAIVATLCLCVGSSGRSFAWPASAFALSIRTEMVLLASLVGASLGAAGVAYQAVLRNPLADPYLLGVSSGASLAAYCWRLLPAAAAAGFGAALSQQAMAFAGGIVAVATVLALASRRGRLDPITLLLVGVIVNAINGSAFLLLNTLQRDLTAGTGGPLGFLVGGLQTDLSRGQELSAAAIAAVALLVLLWIAGQLNVAVLSDAETASLGVRIQRLRWLALTAASAMTAAAVAVSGPIGFVGLVCPHLCRLLVGSDVRRLLPASAALGAALLAIADAASRLLSRPTLAQTQLPVGVLTAMLGGPFFLALLWRSRSRRSIP